MSRGTQYVLENLSEAHAAEVALARVLQTQIALAPRGRYRTGLKTHLDETRDHASRLQTRIKELKDGSNPLQTVVQFAEAVVGQALALTKTPVDLLRGPSGEEKTLKSARDAAASEALEIAMYTALEEIATAAGDEQTAELAASIKADEERMLERILDVIPGLARAAASAVVDGESSYDVSEIGAVDAGRDAVSATQDAVERAGDRAKGAVDDAGDRAKGAATKAGDRVKDRASRTAKRAKDAAEDAGEAVQDAAKSAGERAKGAAKSAGRRAEAAAGEAADRLDDAADEAAETAKDAATETRGRAKSAAKQTRKVPGAARAEGRVKGAVADAEDLPIARYDSLTADEIVSRLPKLSQVDLAKVDTYERKNDDRTTVTDKVKALQGDEPWAGYDELTVAEIRKALTGADEDRQKATRAYEQSHKARAGVLKALDDRASA